LKEAKNKNSGTPFFSVIIGQRVLQISAKNVENYPEKNSKCALHSLKFSFRDLKENIHWGVVKINDPFIDQVKAHFTLTVELISITKRAQMLFLA